MIILQNETRSGEKGKESRMKMIKLMK